MPESNMSISVNGQSQVPPGFRFHPTEEELLQYYLKKKVSNLRIDLDVIGDVDLNKLEPWDIQEKCRIGTTPQNDWYFFSHKDKKYPTGTRTNRATAAGFWKATGRDKAIHSSFRRIGMRKTLVFYKGRAPHGHKSDWIMHEYRLDDNNTALTHYSPSSSPSIMTETGQEEGWVVCRIFKKKSHHKTLDCDHSPVAETRNSNDQLTMMSSMLDEDGREGALEQMFRCVNRTACKEEITNDNNATFVHSVNNHGYMDSSNYNLPGLESPNSTGSQNWHQPSGEIAAVGLGFQNYQTEMITSWAALDRLVASQLNGTTAVDYPSRVCSAVRSSSSSSSLVAKPDDKYYNTSIGQQDYSDEMELWSFARSSSSFSSTDPICHVSDTPT